MKGPPKFFVGIGAIKISKAPAVISTCLGSCIAVCLYDPSQKVGGLLHLMLPSSTECVKGRNIKKTKYADTGIPELLEQLRRVYPVKTEDTVAKIFGGAKVWKSTNNNIGHKNEMSVREILKGLGIKIVASQTGGEKGYRIEFDLEKGRVNCRILGQEPKEY